MAYENPASRRDKKLIPVRLNTEEEAMFMEEVELLRGQPAAAAREMLIELIKHRRKQRQLQKEGVPVWNKIASLEFQ